MKPCVFAHCGKCAILQRVYDKGGLRVSKGAVNCSGTPEACKFYATADQARAGRSRAGERLRHLPEDRQQEIAEKYYGGRKPWEVKP